VAGTSDPEALPVELQGDGHDVGLAAGRGRRQPGERLGSQEGELLGAERDAFIADAGAARTKGRFAKS
jgi:hypothetical protein